MHARRRPLCVLSLPVKRITKWLAISILVLVVLTGIVIARRHSLEERVEERAQETREAEYELARRRYADVLRLGISRKEVEAYLRKNNIVIVNRSYDDLVKIGQEDPPWYCGEVNVYVALQFESRGEQSSRWAQSDSDIL